MNVIIVNDYAHINGGASEVAISTAILLAENGINTCLFTGVGPIDERLLNKENLDIICVGQYDILNDPNRFRAIVNGIWNIKAKKKFRELLSKYNNNNTIIHIHTLQKAISSSCLKVALQLGFKVIYHLHDYGVACPNLGLYNYKQKCICNKKAMSFDCLISNCDRRKYFHKLWRVVRQFIQKKYGGIPLEIVGFIAVSQFSLNILKEYLPIGSKVRIIPNYIDKKEKNSILNIKSNKYLLFIGRLSLEKGPINLAEITAKLKIPIIFIGDGELKDKIKEINPEAVITGWLEKDEMEEYIRKSRCLVLPSVWYETQGMVVQEVAAYGLPALVPNTTAASDFIDDGINGLIYSKEKNNSLEHNIKRIIKDDLLVSYLSENVFKSFYKKNISKEKYIKKIGEFYKEILNE